MKRIIILSLTLFIFFAFSCKQSKVEHNNKAIVKDSLQKPNIIFITAASATAPAMSAYGSKLINTPNIDRIANEGIRFDRSFVTNSICAPSRAVALTGKYSHINRLRDNRDTFDGTQQTFPKLLQKAGYYTAMIGKWHLKSDPTGFDSWKILPGQGNYYNPTFKSNGGIKKQYKGYVTNLITDFALEELKQRDKSKPFALLYFHKAPHRNWMPDLKDLGFYKNHKFPLPETFYDDYRTRSRAAYEQDMRIENMFISHDMKVHLPTGVNDASGGNKKFDAVSSWNHIYGLLTPQQKAVWDSTYNIEIQNFNKLKLKGKELTEWKYQHYIKDYLLTIKSVDENVGRLLDYLEKEGLSDNTIIIYTSDQGFFLGEHGWYDKRFMYEESFSMPLAIRYPNEISPKSASEKLVMNLDIAPTILDYAGINIPSDMQGKSLRSISSKYFESTNTNDSWRKSVYYHYYEYPHGWHNVHMHRGVRTDRYKLIHFYDIDEWELYDLQEDPNEINNIYNNSDYIKIQNELKVDLTNLRKQYKDTE